ncbi:hypothetical protein BA768_02090 [Chryseobacterium sp. CBo1]|nr:hypothetical protein BA768_02090 [Chryseobacterium sp. CBo1]
MGYERRPSLKYQTFIHHYIVEMYFIKVHFKQESRSIDLDFVLQRGRLWNVAGINVQNKLIVIMIFTVKENI